MRLPTVKLRHKRNGAIKIVNQTSYALDLARWADWEIVSVRGSDTPDKYIEIDRKQEIIEKERALNPKSPAYADPKIAYEQRAITTASSQNALGESNEYTNAVTVFVNSDDAPVVADASFVEKEVPVIGGKQTVAVGKPRGRPSKQPPNPNPNPEIEKEDVL